MNGIKYSIVLVIISALFTLSFKGYHKDFILKYPDKIIVHTLPLNAKYLVAVSCNNICDGSGEDMQYNEITDTMEIRIFLNLIGNRKNFTFAKGFKSIDARTSFTYLYNGKMNCICFSKNGLMQKNDSTFNSSKEIRKYLLAHSRLETRYKDLNPGHNGDVTYPDSSYHIPLIPYYDTL